jgi:hypothetical protein
MSSASSMSLRQSSRLPFATNDRERFVQNNILLYHADCDRHPSHPNVAVNHPIPLNRKFNSAGLTHQTKFLVTSYAPDGVQAHQRSIQVVVAAMV